MASAVEEFVYHEIFNYSRMNMMLRTPRLFVDGSEVTAHLQIEGSALKSDR